MSINTWNAKAYSPILMTGLQRKGGLLQTVTVRPGLNNSAEEYIDGIDPIDLDKKQGRLQNTQWEEIGKFRRRITRVEYTKAKILDRNDKLDWVVDPNSNITQELINGAKRAVDDLIVENILGTAYTGETGGTAVSFSSSNIVARDFGGSVTGITKEKIIEARKILQNNYVDLSEEAFLIVSPNQEAEMYLLDEFISADYVSGKPTVTGQIGTLYGLKVIVSNSLSTDSTNSDRECLVYVKSAFTLLMADEFKTRVDEVQEKEYAPGFFASYAFGGSRMDENKVAKILCDE